MCLTIKVHIGPIDISVQPIYTLALYEVWTLFCIYLNCIGVDSLSALYKDNP